MLRSFLLFGFVDYIIALRLKFVNDENIILDETETLLYNRDEVINMNELWKSTAITEISLAVYVAPNAGKRVHKNRYHHGFVLNDSVSVKDYCFDDGRVLHTEGKSLFYLPRGSSYRVDALQEGGCYAINFDADIADVPFCVSPRNAESLRHHFKAACEAWARKDEAWRVLGMRAVYDAIYRAQREYERQYVSSEQRSLLAPALEALNRRFADNGMTVSHLASLCGVSEVYFRRLFLNAVGLSPKEYMIQKRIEYAKSLLLSRNFSVGEVAQMCGYAEPCHFSREFSKRTGVSPSQYVLLDAQSSYP